MKVIMPVAGKGTRLRPHTHSIPKALIRVAGKPIISYIIEQLLKLDISEFVFIIGHLGEQIRSYLEEEYPKVNMKFIRQKEYNGLGHAIYQAKRAYKEDEDMLIVLGDIIFKTDLEAAMSKGHNMIGVMEVTDPSRFGIVTIDKKNIVTSMVEKPDDPPSNLAITGLYYFKSAYNLFDSVEYLIEEDIKTRGEYQLTDAMKNMMTAGDTFETFDVPEWYDCGAKESLLDTNEIMLRHRSNNNQIKGSVIIPPVFVGKNVLIVNSIIGPNVSISEGSEVRNSIIKESILGVNSTVKNTILEKSLIGDYAYLKQTAIEFNIGPDSEMIFTR